MPKTKITIDDLAKITKAGFDAVDKKFDAVDKRFDAIDKKFDSVDKKFDSVDKKFSEMEYNLKSYLDDKLADLKGDIVAVIKGDRERDQVFKIKLLSIIRRNKLAKTNELKLLSELIR